MYFAHDTEFALRMTTALVNTLRNGEDTLATVADLAGFLDEFEFTGVRDGTVAELDDVRSLRPRLRAVWDADGDLAAVDIVNSLLREADAMPRLTRHGDWDWHLHVTRDDDSVRHRVGAEGAMAFVDLIRNGDLDRLKRCAAPDCDAVLIDLSRNRSRLFCDTGNCGNRMNVAAYRARKAAGERR